MKSKALREQRAVLAKQAQDILNKADAEKRNMSAEENQAFDTIHAEIDSLKVKVDQIERQERVDAELAARKEGEQEKNEQRKEIGRDNTNGTETATTETDRSNALRAWMLSGSDQQPTPEQRAAADRCGWHVNSRQVSLRYSRSAPRSVAEARALSVGSLTAGGATAPDEMMRSIEIALLEHSSLREHAQVVRTTTGNDIPFPTCNDTSNKGEIVGENQQVSEQDVTFGQLVINAWMYSSKMVRVSMQLLQDSNTDIPALVGSLLGTRTARITNEHFTTGDGNQKPRGFAAISTLGKTGTTGQTTTVIFEDLVDLEHSVDPSYRKNAKFSFRDSTLAILKKLKDSEARPLWLPGIAVQEPDRILGYPYFINQDIAAMAASAKSIFFGDWKKYIVRDVLDWTLVRLDERYADFGQVAFLGWSRHDGDLLDAGTAPLKHYANAAS